MYYTHVYICIIRIVPRPVLLPFVNYVCKIYFASSSRRPTDARPVFDVTFDPRATDFCNPIRIVIRGDYVSLRLPLPSSLFRLSGDTHAATRGTMISQWALGGKLQRVVYIIKRTHTTNTHTYTQFSQFQYARCVVSSCRRKPDKRGLSSEIPPRREERTKRVTDDERGETSRKRRPPGPPFLRRYNSAAL